MLAVMERANGCENDGGPIALSVSNHTDVSQDKGGKPTVKLVVTQSPKMPQSSSGSSKSSRSRRKTVIDSPNSLSSSSPSSSPPEKRAARHVSSHPPKTLAERKATNAQTPATTPSSSPTNKKLSNPPNLSPQVPSSSTDESHEVPVIRQTKRLHHSLVCSSPPMLTSQKRSIKKTASHATADVELSPPSPRASKRVRLQHQPFQSPSPPALIPAILRQPHTKTPEDKICVFQKGEFLAVRNENGSFFVCRTAQNVYKSSKRFKIQWMSDQEPDLYIPDFYDQTDFECVLTNLRLKRVDKNKFRLPGEERQRTLNILQRALNVENGIDISKFQVTTDGVDVSVVGKEEEVLQLQQQQQSLSPTHSGSPPLPHLRNRGRPRQAKVAASPKVTRSSATPTVMVPKKAKTLATRVKLRSRETVKVKLKKEGGKVIISNKARKAPISKTKSVERLHPNSKVTLYEKDPTFETNVPVPYVSSSAHSRLLIRAIHLRDINMLTSLMKDTQRICSLNCFRSVDIKLTPLAYAVIEEDHRSIKCLLNANRRKYANPPETLLEYQTNQRANIAMLGFAVKSVQMSRGGREGNNAFLKDLNFCDSTYPKVDVSLIKEALRVGVSMETLNVLFPEGQEEYSWQINEVLQNIAVAVRHGHHKLAGQLVTQAVERGGFGFNFLHKEVLVKERQQLSKFKPVSVIKKAISKTNARITPLHCAAINPNPQYLAALLAVYPEYNLPDDGGWRPIHYAAACQTTGPLELLIARGVSLDDVESEGNSCLHVAASAGRAHNIDLILRHLKASDCGKKETNTDIPPLEKANVAMVDRGNKKSFTALHLACQYGHVDVVRVLLRHKANTDKQTNAQHEKLTALMLASQKGQLEIAHLLYDATARVEMKDKKQRTALTHAVINGHAHVTSFLLGLGANPNTTDSSGNTLVHYAAAYGWYFCLKLLVEAGASLNLPNDWKITPLSLAFMKGHMGLVDFLVEQPGIDINVDVHNESGMTLVMQALRSRINHSMLERIHFLVAKQKSDCSRVDFMGNNALHHLVLAEVEEMKREQEMEEPFSQDDSSRSEDEGSTGEAPKELKSWSFKEEAQQEHDALVQEVAKLLLDHGCNPMMKNKEGESPFNLAVKEGCLLLVKMFLESGCQLVLEVSVSGDNILHYLVSHACSRKVEPMLQAILNAKCSDNSLTSHQLLCQMAKMYNKKGHTPLLQALTALKSCKEEESKNRLLSFTKFLIDELGADVSAPCLDDEGKPICYALHLASLCRGGNVIEVLLAHKAPLNSLNSDGQTPLILAIKKENIDAIEALIKAGAMVNAKSTRDGNLSPLLLASKSPKLGKITQFLVHNKADVNEVDPKNKNTALHYVVSLRASDVLETTKALLTAGANVNAMNDKRRTPLHLAVNASSSDSDASYAVEECLIGFGAACDAIDCRGRTPLHYAFTKIGRHTDSGSIDPMELVVLLIDAMPAEAIELPDNFGRTVLHAAAYRGATISSMHIAKFMKDLDMKDKDGNTALGLAVKNGHESCTLMLLQRGASCISEVVFAPEVDDTSSKSKSYWEWKHTIKTPPPVKRHTVLQETLQRDWQGILYLMLDQLEAIGKGINVAVEAALRTAKYNVALKLIGKIKHGWTLYNEKNSMLHLLSREAPSNYFSDLQVKVAQFLIEKTVPVMARDEHGCSALTYAAINWNYALCIFFSVKSGMPASSLVDYDRSSRTALSAIFWKLGHKDLPEDMRNWCSTLVKGGGKLNILTHYPIADSPYPGVPCVALENALFIEDNSVARTSPLIMAIRKQNYPVVKFLINLGADVNFPDELKRTPLMHAARMNDIRMVKLLLNSNYDPTKDKSPHHDIEAGSFQKTSSITLDSQDVKGWSVIHHLVSPLPDYCYSDCTLLQLLSHLGASLELKNSAGEMPLDMAIKMKREPYIWMLQELLKVPLASRVNFEAANDSVMDVEFEPVTWDYKTDSEKVMSTHLEASAMKEENILDAFPPDPSSGMVENCQVVMDENKGIPYDALMTVVDLNYGAYGIYNFYKMQIIKHTVKELFVLFTCWGRVGDVGQHQKTPFSSINDATKEFCRIFKAKSGNHWEDVMNFQPQAKKYRLVHLDKRRTILQKKSIKVELKYDVSSKLDQLQQKLMKDLMNVHVIEGSLRDLGIEATFDVLPFGKLTESSLSEARDLLIEIGNVITERDNLQQTSKSQEKFSDLMHKIVKLSEDFYQLLPIYGYQYERLCPLFCTSDVHDKLVLIDNLMHIGLASRMLLAAHSQMNDINPMDYVYLSLGCRLIPLDKDSQEAQMLLQYIHNTCLSHKIKVECIYQIKRPVAQKSEGFQPSRRKYLLWHGTRLSNILGILYRGLQASPLGVPISGDLLGKGIYLADMFAKSLHYCHSEPVSRRKCMFLCEADLGEMKEVESSLVLDKNDKLDSIKALGHRQPDPAGCISWNGVTVPLGCPINALDQGASSQHRFLDFNEYVVYESSRVSLRYLVQFSC